MKSNCKSKSKSKSNSRLAHSDPTDVRFPQASNAPNHAGRARLFSGRCIFLALGLALAVMGWSAARVDAALTETWTFNNVNKSIPDFSADGVSDVQSISSALSHITVLSVTLNITGDYNGDLYGYLRHGDGFSVLLNRVGRTTENSYGYADSGFAVTFSDTAANDIHNYQSFTIPDAGSPLTGTWQPDARSIDPDLVLDTSPRTADFSSFTGLAPTGEWTLFLADMNAGGTSTLNSWSMEITAAPEPVNVALSIFAGLAAAVKGLQWFRRKGKRGLPGAGLNPANSA